MGGSILDLATEMGIGLTAWASTGKQVDLDVIEVADALLDAAAVRRIMLRAGRSAADRRGVASHTGSMLGDDAVFVLTSQKYGVV